MHCCGATGAPTPVAAVDGQSSQDQAGTPSSCLRHLETRPCVEVERYLSLCLSSVECPLIVCPYLFSTVHPPCLLCANPSGASVPFWKPSESLESFDPSFTACGLERCYVPRGVPRCSYYYSVLGGQGRETGEWACPLINNVRSKTHPAIPSSELSCTCRCQ